MNAEATQLLSAPKRFYFSGDDDASKAIRAERLVRRVESLLKAPPCALNGSRPRFDSIKAKAHANDVEAVAKAVLRDAGGKVLLLKDAHYGTWDLPGGHLTEGETLEDGLRREISEETGLSATVENRRAEKPEGVIFDARTDGNEPSVTLSEEHSDYRWVSEGKAKELSAFWLGRPFDVHAEIRSEAQATIQSAVNQVVALASAQAVTGKHRDDYEALAAMLLLGAIALAYGTAARKLAVNAKGADHVESLTSHEEWAHAGTREEYLKRFPVVIQERLDLEAKRGIELGETPQEITRRVHEEAGKILEGVGNSVAGQEAQEVYGSGQMRAIKRAGYNTSFWVTVGDERVCGVCDENEAAGQVKVGEKFPSGHASSPAHVGCRCWLEGASKR